jgi:drug/metabolite transporter (DMT)-like permease
MGLVNPVAYYLVLLRAYELLPAQQAQAINYTWAITLAVLGIPLLGHRLTLRDGVAVLMGYGGVLVIATRGRVLELEFTSGEGVTYALLSTLLWALYWIASTRNRRDPVTCLCLNFLLATPVALLACALFSSLSLPGWRGAAGAIYVGLFEMGVTFALWSTALRLASGVSRVGNLIFLSPLISLVFIASILGEPIHPATLAGLALILPGLLLQQGRRQAAPAGR